MESTELAVDTSGRQLTDLTSQVSDFCRSRGDGLLSVFVPHATAGVALMRPARAPKPISTSCWGACCRATTATGTATARTAMAQITCSRS